MAMQTISEDEYSPAAVYAPVTRTLTRKQFGAYVLVGVRTPVNPNIPGDTETVHALQDGVKIEQPGRPGMAAGEGEEAVALRVRQAAEQCSRPKRRASRYLRKFVRARSTISSPRPLKMAFSI